ncbi:MAG: uroporphyrinogen decarboxylase family protein [Kiritimatiellae bacterium]|nr:uroporphyrinogen decarboxylase family protein [Kiritimatiellia bacterium]
MNDKERFLSIAHFEKPDYVPIFGFGGAPGMAHGCQQQTYDRLIATGMPRHVVCHDQESWNRYWGTTGAIGPGFSLGSGAQGFHTTTRREGEFEIIESENGAITRQVIDNTNTYSMPEFIRFPVRDRASWEFYKERTQPKVCMTRDEMNEHAKKVDLRTKPLGVEAGSTYGTLRGLMGPEGASLAFYDDPELVRDIADHILRGIRERAFPLIERLKPEVVLMGEDLCYNHGMLVSPAQFDEFYGRHYREVCACARANGAALVAIDTDGNAMEFVPLVRRYGVNAMYPFEVKAGNDLFALRKAYPEFILFGWLEKEVVNEGNEDMIKSEIMSKVPRLLKQGGYFPNGDHGIQPLVTFPNLCKFMTLLHEVCHNPEGEFPRC